MTMEKSWHQRAMCLGQSTSSPFPGPSLPIFAHPLQCMKKKVITRNCFLTTRATSALNSSRGGDVHMHATARRQERARTRPQIRKLLPLPNQSPNPLGRVVWWPDRRKPEARERKTENGSPRISSWRSLVTMANLWGPQINTRRVERDIFDGDAELDKQGLWAKAKL